MKEYDIESIDKMLEAQKSIMHLLHPLPQRARERILIYFSDVVSDPDAECDKEAKEIVLQVADILGITTP